MDFEAFLKLVKMTLSTDSGIEEVKACNKDGTCGFYSCGESVDVFKVTEMEIIAHKGFVFLRDDAIICWIGFALDVKRLDLYRIVKHVLWSRKHS